MPRLSSLCATLFLAAILSGSAAPRAFAISAELAKQCREMMVKAYPPVLAGTRKGTAQAERDFFQNCIANDGKVDMPSTQTPAVKPAPAPTSR